MKRWIAVAVFMGIMGGTVFPQAVLALVETAQVACGVVATALLPASSEYRWWTIKNQDASNTVFLGGSAVTSSTGYALKAGDTLNSNGTTQEGRTFTLGDPLYCVVASTTTTVHRMDIK